MLKQGLQQKLQQKLSPLQIQTIKLLELPTLELEQRIKKELEENPVLDEGSDEEDREEIESGNVSLSDYGAEDQIPSYKLYANNQGKDIKQEYSVFSVKESFHQSLISQLGFSDMDEHSKAIARYIIGSLDDDGYLRRDTDSLADDIAFRQGILTDKNEVEYILSKIQEFEPAGIGARDLRECLLLQIKTKRESKYQKMAREILEDYFTEFTKKHYSKIISRMGITEEDPNSAIEEILHLNPRPGVYIDD